jgi:hypothetical protein
MSEYYLKNREKILEYNKKYYWEHLQEKKDYNRKYNELHTYERFIRNQKNFVKQRPKSKYIKKEHTTIIFNYNPDDNIVKFTF